MSRPRLSPTAGAEGTDAQPRVELHHVDLSYPIHRLRHPTLKHTLTDWFRVRGPKTQTLDAIRDVSFDLTRGDRLGVIGRNGAGKSSLLRTVAGIYEPTRGRVETHGFMVTLFQLGLGFHAELTATDNIMQAGALLGLPAASMRQRIPHILSFASLEEFADVPIKYLSTGMAMRLAFTTATEFPPDILVLDEVLTGGDGEFRERATARMEGLMAETGIVILVSHALPIVQRLCNRVLWLDQGAVRMDGGPAETISAYRSSMERNAPSA